MGEDCFLVGWLADWLADKRATLYPFYDMPSQPSLFSSSTWPAYSVLAHRRTICTASRTSGVVVWVLDLYVYYHAQLSLVV